MTALRALMLVVTLVTFVEVVAAVPVRRSILVHLRRARAELLGSGIAVAAHIVDFTRLVSTCSIARRDCVPLTLSLLLG